MNILLLIILSLISVDKPQVYTVMAVSGLNLRSEPSVNSRVLKKLTFGTLVYSEVQFINNEYIERSNYKDEINDVVGCWIKVKLENDGIEGFLFSPYIHYGDIVNRDLSRTRVIHEGYNCLNETGFHPDLDWVGVYKQENYMVVKKVEVELKLSAMDSIELPMELEYDWYATQNWSLETNIDETSAFLIGSKYAISEGKFEIKYESEPSGYSPAINNGFIFPEQKLELYNAPYNYRIRGEELVKLDTSNLQLRKSYDLFYGIRHNEDRTFNEISLKSYLKFCCDAKKHAIYQTPTIEMLVDLNNDNILDLVMRGHTMTEGCGGCLSKSVLISGMDENGSSFSFSHLGSAVECSCM